MSEHAETTHHDDGSVTTVTSACIGPDPARDEDAALVKDAVGEVRGELSRADAKASMLLAATGAATAVVASSGYLVGEGSAVWVTRLGLVLLVAVVVVLLSTVRPRLKGAPFMEATGEEWRPQAPRDRMRSLARVAQCKFRRIRLAVDLLAAAVVVLVAGIALTGTV